MATKKQDAAINLYAKLMEEAKSRLACVSLAVNGKTGLPGPAVREFCFLQFRMICELISLGCLTAHGDIQATTRLRDEWSAKNILSQLEKLHPDFYPFPSEKETDGRNHHLTPITEGFLTKADLLNLNGKCGDILHRGSLKKLLSPNSPVQVHFPDIDGWAKKIARLLDIHSIALLGGEAYIVCLMSSNENGGRVQVAIAEAQHE
jgi:hypothetical protein